MTDLLDKQFEVNGLLIGSGCDIIVTDFTPKGIPDITNQDKPITGGDGIWFGRDTQTGNLIAIDGACCADSAQNAWALYGTLLNVWNAAKVRSQTGAVCQLRMKMPGCQPVTVFGRPRQCDPASTAYNQAGVIPWTANFQAVDNLFYSDTEYSLTLGLIPPTGGGVTFPVTFPLSWAPGATAPGAITVAGDSVTYPVVRFTGPSTSGALVNPSLTYTALGLSIQYSGSIPVGDYVELDMRPWVRTALSRGGGSVAGLLTGNAMREMGLPPGLKTELAFNGQDSSGTSSATVTWREASTSPYMAPMPVGLGVYEDVYEATY